MFDLISIGSISIDLFFKGESLTFKENRFQLAVGGKYVAQHFYESVGGSGSNVAIGGAKNGLRTGVFGLIGRNPFQHIILDKLEEQHVSSKLCHFIDGYYNISAILLSPKGERSIVHYVTPHQHVLKYVSINRLVETKILYLGNLSDVSLTEREELLNICNKHQIPTVVNLGVKDCRRDKSQLENFLRKIDILILNGHEFADLVKAQYKDIHFREDVVEWYIPHLLNKLVLVTEGAKGSYAYCNGSVFHQPSVKPNEIIDTTGAGDGYTAGFIAEYLRSSDIEKAMYKAAHYASKILGKIGAN